MSQSDSLQTNGTEGATHLQENEELDDDLADAEQTDVVETENGSAPRKRQPRRTFPSHSFEEALQLALAIHQNAPSGVVRRLTLFSVLNKSADSSTSRNWIASANKYGLIKGNFHSDNLELTEEGKIVSGDEFSEYERTAAKVELAIFRIAPFRSLYDDLAGNKRFPDKQFVVDIAKNYVPDSAVNEAVDIFTVNAKYVGLLTVIAGAQRLLTLDYLLDNLSADPTSEMRDVEEYDEEPQVANATPVKTIIKQPLDDVCFYITPIGESGSEQRLHADLFMDHIIRPALSRVGSIDLRVVRADNIESTGIITNQIIRHLLQSRLVIADLSFHNPNVFYELAIRHASRLPTVHVIRTSDSIPFDVNQMRTVKIDTSSIYTLIPRLDTYRSEIALQVRRALEGDETPTNPITIFYPTFKVTID